MEDTAAIIVAGGRGVRLGPGGPKVLEDLCGVPVLVRACSPFRGRVVVVVAPAGMEPEFGALVPGAVVVAGGARRQDSVRAGLTALPEGVTRVLVHDAARPLVSARLVQAVLDALQDHPAVVPVVEISSTVKEVDDRGRVVRTVPRAGLCLAQTPQGFHRAVLERAMTAAGDATFTDEAAMVESLGEAVHTVAGSAFNLKITTPEDLDLARAFEQGDKP